MQSVQTHGLVLLKRFVFLVFISLGQVWTIKAWITGVNSRDHFYSQRLWIKWIGTCVLLYSVDTDWVSGTPPANSFCVDFINILLIQLRHAALRHLEHIADLKYVNFPFSV